MPRASPIQTDFSTGEISPMVMGRVDADRYRSALAKCENFYPTAQGALIRRSGTRFVNEIADSSVRARLVPFIFSNDQAYILEFNPLLMRVYANYGIVESSPGTPFTLSIPWDIGEIDDISWIQSGDILYVVHPDHQPRKIIRLDDDNWTIDYLITQDGPYLDTVTPGYDLVTSGLAQVGDKFTLTLTAGPELTVSSTTNLGSGITQVNFSASHGLAKGGYIAFNDGSNYYGPFEIIQIDDADTLRVDYGTYLDLATFKARPAPFINTYSTEAGRKFRVLYSGNWVSGTLGLSGSAWEGVGAAVSASMDSTIPDTTTITSWRFGAYWGDFSDGSNGWPSAIGFHEDRLVIGGAPGLPQRTDLSQSSDYENFAPTEADGTVVSNNAISFSLNQGGIDAIRWYSSDEQGLLIGTAGAEYWARGSTQYEAISPTNINVKKSTSYGSAPVNPVQAGKGTMFVQPSGRKVRELAYFWDVNGYRATDMSILSEHITQGGLVELAYQKEPFPIIWAVREDGALLGLSYDRDLDNLRAGWHRHIIGGVSTVGGDPAVVESIACIPSPDGTRNDLWLIVRRRIDGGTARYVEYIEKVFSDDVEQEDGFFVDAGLTYDGSPADTVSGLDHLEGQSVSVCGDGAFFPDQIVSGGEITISQECSVIHIGLAFSSEAKLLRLDSGSADGTSIGKRRKIPEYEIMINRSAAFEYGMNFISMDELTFRESTDPLNAATPLKTDIVNVRTGSGWDKDAQLCIRQNKPLPLSILAIAPQIVVEGKG